MKNILLFCTVLLIAGCSTTVPVKQKFPEAPKTLTEKCPNLELIDKPTVLLSELILVITKNYMKYHECSAQVDGWNEWYQQQKKIFDETNK
jgi:hypothetical protein